ncbi:MAG: pectinesterase family protein [Bacteroidia bacterium]
MTLVNNYFSTVVLLLLVIGMFLPSRLSAQSFSPDITVALDNTGDFVKIQDAIDAVPDNSHIPTIIYIKRGLYNTEKLIVPATKTNVIFIGESRDETIISYHIYDCATGGFSNKCPAADAQLWSSLNLQTSATLTILGDDFLAENLTIENTAGPVGQAQAITVRSDRVIFRNCNLTGYQDTIYFWSDAKRTYFQNCLITGRTDYIYGSGTAWFESCEIRSWGGGWITAPSTGLNQPFGFVFHACQITYALNSPRAGDDGAMVALGRPWHNFPKVAWLYCDMTGMINPLGWPDKWNMPYADSSTDLHLYEYKNTGPGSDMSGRANWAGIRALTDSEAVAYTVLNVLSGTDGWNPNALAPIVPVYHWTGADSLSDWLLPGNWDPLGIPDTSEAAYVTGPDTITASGGYFAADLALSDYATLLVSSPSEVSYFAAEGAIIQSESNTSLYGRIRTKDSLIVNVVTDTFDLNAEIIGVHVVQKSGEGVLQLNSDASAFSGHWVISSGNVTATNANSLGKARDIVADSLAYLTIAANATIYTQTALTLNPGSQLILYTDIDLLEFYLGDSLQPVGVYSATTHPGIIGGTGTLTVGRPASFFFVGGANGNWDNPAHFQPALIPQSGDSVITDREMETTSFIFPADIFVQSGGRIRLRGTHSATGNIFLEAGTGYLYSTSGTGFTLNAPTVVLGDISFNLNSRAVPAHAMRLGGPVSGNTKITILNSRTDTENTGSVVLSGDNNGFTGTWDLTAPAGHPNSIATLAGEGENSLGQGLIEVAFHNRVVLKHPACAGAELRVNLSDNASVQLDTAILVNKAVFNGVPLAVGTYTAISHPAYFSGPGSLTVDGKTGVENLLNTVHIFVSDRYIHVEGIRAIVCIYDLSGRKVVDDNASELISLHDLPCGIYVVKYLVNGWWGVKKIIVD